MKYWLLFVSAILFIPNLSSRHLIYMPDRPIKNERFDAKLVEKIQNIHQLIAYVDSTAAIKGIKQNTNSYADLILETVEDRFFHSYSHYSLNNNWIAALGGRYIWYDISAIVKPDDILKYPMAACSQQSIVLMSFFSAKNIPYRKVGFDGHYAVTAEFNKQWIFFDADFEPQKDQNVQHLSYLLKGKHIYEYYKNVLTPAQSNKLFKHIVIGETNAEPASHISLFHTITSISSHWLWVLPMALFLILMMKKYIGKYAKAFSESIFLIPTQTNLQYTFHHFSETPNPSLKKVNRL